MGLAEQLQGMETRDCSYIIAPGRAEGQKAGINNPIFSRSRRFGQEHIGEEATAIGSVLESWGDQGGDGAALGSAVPGCPLILW